VGSIGLKSGTARKHAAKERGLIREKGRDAASGFGEKRGGGGSHDLLVKGENGEKTRAKNKNGEEGPRVFRDLTSF